MSADSIAGPKVSAARLVKWATAAEMAADELSYAGAALHEGNPLAASENVQAAREALRLLQGDLADAGAEAVPLAPERGLGLPMPPSAAEVELLAALDAAVAIAERVDAQRGHVLPAHIPLQPGETRGTGIAETLSNLRQRLTIEVYGPAGLEG